MRPSRIASLRNLAKSVAHSDSLARVRVGERVSGLDSERMVVSARVSVKAVGRPRPRPMLRVSPWPTTDSEYGYAFMRLGICPA